MIGDRVGAACVDLLRSWSCWAPPPSARRRARRPDPAPAVDGAVGRPPPPVPPDRCSRMPPPEYQTTVTALRLPRPLPDVPSTVTVLPREELERTPALGMDELVRLVARGHHLPAHAFAAGRPHLPGAEPARGRALGRVAGAGAGRRRARPTIRSAAGSTGAPCPAWASTTSRWCPGAARPCTATTPWVGWCSWPAAGYEPAFDVDLAGGSLRTASAGRPGGGPARAGWRAPSSSTACAPPATSRWPPPSAGPSTSPARAGTAAPAPGASCSRATPGGWARAAALFVEEQNGGTALTTADVVSGTYALDRPARDRGLGRPGAGGVGQHRALRPDPPAHRRRCERRRRSPPSRRCAATARGRARSGPAGRWRWAGRTS